MAEYCRARVPGATWVFTVGLVERRGNDLLVENIDAVRSAFRAVRDRHPVHMDAVVVLPDHLHCIWTLSEGDADYSTRWSLIKATFSRELARGERRSASRMKRGERAIWQWRFWEHCLRDENDYVRHVGYIHWNRVKHGHVQRETEWVYSSFHRYVAWGVYALDWGGGKRGELTGVG